MKKIALLSLASLILLSSACSMSSEKRQSLASSEFLDSGTIIVSGIIPTTDSQFAQSHHTSSDVLAPLIGYFPPAESYLPADNEAWLQVDSKNMTVTLYRGKKVFMESFGEGFVHLTQGRYFLRKKSAEPLWYASDSYFQTRKLNVPPTNNSERFLSGALGEIALYPSDDFPIHNARIWSEEVGGLKVDDAFVQLLFSELNEGSVVVIK